jgi:hypothetical protein
MSDYETAHASMVRIEARKDGLTGVFGVAIKRTAYFFKDRSAVVDQSGGKKRIFHIVRPHVRANGQAVKLHFRGLRKFNWNGYDIAISVPGRDHLLLQGSISALSMKRI